MTQLDIAKFIGAIRLHRSDQGLRDAAGQIGISASTLSRIENGRLPDLPTFFALCDWLGAHPSEFIDSQNCDKVDIRSTARLKQEILACRDLPQDFRDVMVALVGAIEKADKV